MNQCTVNDTEWMGGATGNVTQAMRENTSSDGESKIIGANPKGTKLVHGLSGTSGNEENFMNNKNYMSNEKSELLSSIV